MNLNKVALFILSALFCSLPLFGASIQYQNIFPSHLKLLKSKKLFNKTTPYELDKVISTLMLTNQYEKISVYEKKGSPPQIIIKGIPHKKIRSISIEGVTAFSQSEIESLLSIQKKDRFIKSKIIQNGQSINDFYEKQGFLNAQVSIQYTDISPKEVQIRFIIKEGAPCIIKDIHLETPNIQLIKKLHKITKKFIQKKFSAANTHALKVHLEEYLLKNHFLTAEVIEKEAVFNKTKTQVKLIYSIKQPYQWEIDLKGNYFFSSSYLLKLLNLKQSRLTLTNPVSILASLIKKRYLEEGFANIKITIEFLPSRKPFQRKVLLKIKEGYRVRIENIEFTGQYSRPPSYYKKLFLENVHPLVRKGFYNLEYIRKGLENLKILLQNEGYVRAKVLSFHTEKINKKPHHINLVINLIEGPLTRIKDIQFIGVKRVKKSQLMKVLQLQPQSPLKLNQLKQKIENLIQFYKSKGFLEATLLTSESDIVKYEKDPSWASLHFKIYEGPQIKVASIVVSGNHFTKDFVILRTVTFKKGDILTPELIEESIARLNNMGIFTNIEIQTLEVGSSLPERTVIILVSEGTPGIFKLGAGFSSKGEDDLNIRGFTKLTYNNIKGTARAISARLDASTNLRRRNKFPENKVTLGYLEPFLFSSRTRGRINLIFSQSIKNDSGITDPSSGKEILEIEESQKVNLLLERDIGRYTKFTWRLWTLDSTKTFQSPKNSSILEYPNTDTQVVLIGPSISIDTRNNPFLPKQGSLTELDIDYSSKDFGSSDNNEFIKIETRWTLFTPFFKGKLIWSNTLRGGYLENLSPLPNSGVPERYAFFLGGSTTLRSFSSKNETNRHPSSKYFSDYKNSKEDLIKTSSTYWLAKTELKFPIYKALKGAIFYDLGHVQVNDQDYATTPELKEESQKPRHSVGAGLRIDTPVGPVSIDYAVDVSPGIPKEDRQDAIHFTIGLF
ncbi:MAG: outer membrane protein assembly factor [Bdellovibrio sp.]|nr:MAG: outer membrane protein assembly factor [Bdellovibrio sp.]